MEEEIAAVQFLRSARKMDAHQTDGLGEWRASPRFTNKPEIEGAPIEQVVL
jgi:hypothetical protein